MTGMHRYNQVALLQNHEAYFPVMEAALDRAVHEIYVESYIFEDDNTGRRIAEALRRAALRGVKTHLLIDGFGSQSLPKSMIAHLKTAGVMVRKFRPKVSPWTFRRSRLRRLHRKIVVVDAKIAFVGGMNIADEIHMPDQPSPHFDFAVSVEGPLVEEIHTSCRRIWSRVAIIRSRTAAWTAGRRKSGREVPPTQPKGDMRAAFLMRDNFRHRRDIENAYLQAIDQARGEIIIANAYFLPGLNFRHALLSAARRGVRVVLLLQGKMDYPLLHLASRALYGSFLDAGIEIYQYHTGFLHAKVAVIDTHWSTVGSSNLDPFSLLLALEANIVIDDQDFAAALKHSLDQAVATGAIRVFKDSWRSQPFMLRLVSWLSYGMVRFMVGMAVYAPKQKQERLGAF